MSRNTSYSRFNDSSQKTEDDALYLTGQGQDIIQKGIQTIKSLSNEDIETLAVLAGGDVPIQKGSLLAGLKSRFSSFATNPGSLAIAVVGTLGAVTASPALIIGSVPFSTYMALFGAAGTASVIYDKYKSESLESSLKKIHDMEGDIDLASLSKEDVKNILRCSAAFEVISQINEIQNSRDNNAKPITITGRPILKNILTAFTRLTFASQSYTHRAALDSSMASAFPVTEGIDVVVGKFLQHPLDKGSINSQEFEKIVNQTQLQIYDEIISYDKVDGSIRIKSEGANCFTSCIKSTRQADCNASLNITRNNDIETGLRRPVAEAMVKNNQDRHR